MVLCPAFASSADTNTLDLLIVGFVARFVVEAVAGSFEQWGVRRGSTVVVRECRP